MRSVSIPILAILGFSGALTAHQLNAGREAISALRDAEASVSSSPAEPCPLRMSLKLGPAGTTLLAKGPTHTEVVRDAKGNEHHVSVRDVQQMQVADLQASNTAGKDITAIDAHVQGYSAHPRLQPAAPRTPPIDDGTWEALHLTQEIPGNASKTVSLSYKRTIVTQFVQIDRVLFKDGSAWERNSASSCKVMPDLFVLVDTGKSTGADGQGKNRAGPSGH